MVIMRERRGFTLIELLVVIAIIGILASIVLVSLGQARAKARDSIRVQNLKQVALALEMYALENGGKYPDDPNLGYITSGLCSSSVDVAETSCWQCNRTNNATKCRYDSVALEDSVGLYLKQRPCDPSLPGNNTNGGCQNSFSTNLTRFYGFWYKTNRERTEYKIAITATIEDINNVPVSLRNDFVADPANRATFHYDNLYPGTYDDSIVLASSEQAKTWEVNCSFVRPPGDPASCY